tara:strand:+ start:5046 stop:5330 length:285 start_codon:yes stop_codon:yes gene_type:complete
MTKSEITRELNTLRIVLYDLIGDSDIGEHYIDILNKTISIVGSNNWEFSSDYFNIKCDEIAGDVNIDVYHKETLIDSNLYKLDSIISDEESGEA